METGTGTISARITLLCPASSMDLLDKERPILPCKFSLECNPAILDDDLRANGQMLVHLRDNHNFYWKRNGKKLVTRFSKQYAMRNK